MPTMSQASYCNFLLIVFLFSYCRGLFKRYLSAKNGIFGDVTITLAIRNDN